MKRINTSVLITLGQSARYLFDVKAGWSIHEQNTILSNINGVLLTLKQLGFPVTLQAADGLLKIKGEFEKTSASAKISVSQQARLSQTMDRLRHTLQAESQIQVAYVLTEKRLGVRKLVEEPESFLAKGTFGRLPKLAQLDIREAGKCIGFEVPTAAAFHLLRATEGTLRSYHNVFVKRGHADHVTWGGLVNSLRTKKKKPKPDETLLNHLDHIRKNFRNPTDHPDMTYDMDGVQDLFSLVADALNRMAKELPEEKPNSLYQALLTVSPKAELGSATVPSEANPTQTPALVVDSLQESNGSAITTDGRDLHVRADKSSRDQQ